MNYETLIKELSDNASAVSLSLLEKLKKYNLNIVTAESITGGQIVKTLVDNPGFSKWIYGGEITYDSDAKRKWLGVTTGDVYTTDVVEEMASGALQKSRAMVGVAVSGCGGPTPEDKVGEVYNGVGLVIPFQNLDSGRWGPGKLIKSKKVKILDYPLMKEFLKTVQKNDNTDKQIRTLIRYFTVIDALKMVSEELDDLVDKDILKEGGYKNLEAFKQEPYDGKYTEYGEPSPVISSYI